MGSQNKLKVFALFLGDVIALYFSLFATLFLRYRTDFYSEFAQRHFQSFTVIFIFWIIIFYIAGLYDLRQLREKLNFFKALFLAMAVNAVTAILSFYLIQPLGIAPKTNLFLFLAIFTVVEIGWRNAFVRIISGGEAANRILLIGEDAKKSVNETACENQEWLKQLGYEICCFIKENGPQLRDLKNLVRKKKINLVIVPRRLKNDPRLTHALYELLGIGIRILDVSNFCETTARKIPLSDLEETWFLENLTGRQKFYDPLKRAGELLTASAMTILLFPLLLLIGILIKLTSPGPILIRQKRIGENGGLFILYKFRSMVALAADGQAETNGAQWSVSGDKRATPLGKVLRHTHTDELPQLWNVIKGNLSFVGPRPERPEIADVLKEKIPYYEMRLLVKPGISGWAQIHHRADISKEDVVEKLQYDIYYVKNRSPILDLAIILKTIKTLFVTPK